MIEDQVSQIFVRGSPSVSILYRIFHITFFSQRDLSEETLSGLPT
jgi:hypothetical protein